MKYQLSNCKIALFGEAEKGVFDAAYLCRDLTDLNEFLGEPPNKDSQGLNFAIQSLLYDYTIIYFRVHEEGFSKKEYLQGLDFLQQQDLFPKLSAICLPGVGDHKIISATTDLCFQHKSCLVLTEKDLYDYLSNF